MYITGITTQNHQNQVSHVAIYIVENKQLRTNFGENLFQTITSNNSEKVVIQKFLKLINQNGN